MHLTQETGKLRSQNGSRSRNAAVTGAAAKTFNKKVRTVKKEWIKPDTFALIEEKRNCVRGGTRYKDFKRQVRSRLRGDRADHLMSICQEANEHARKNRSKHLFPTVD